MKRIGFVLALVLAGWSARVQATDDFRVETKIFPGKEANPSSEITTLFHSGKVYDYLGKPAVVTVFDPQHDRVILLDTARKIRAEVKYEELTQFASSLRARAIKASDPLLKFSAEPHFEQSLDTKSGDMVFSSTYMTYQVATQKSPLETAAKQYREFADASARLNARVNRGSMPPFPRLAVNEVLVSADLIPQSVQLTELPRQRVTGSTLTVRSEHQAFWRLVDSDRRRIDETASSLVTYTQVSLDEYLRRSDDQAKK